MHQAVKTAILAAGLVVAVMMPDATAQYDRSPQSWIQAAPIGPFTSRSGFASDGEAYRRDPGSSASFGYPFQLVSYDPEPPANSDLNAQPYAPMGDLLSQKPAPKPTQQAIVHPAVLPKVSRLPRKLQPKVAHIQFSAPVLAPMSHTLFCIHYPQECRVQKIVFRGGPLKLTNARRAQLERINADVNRSIIPKRDTKWLAGKGWSIAPKAGDCNDFAVTKRHDLLARGWPERALLLSEVVTSWGEHHLVLVVRTNEGDLVADNLTPKIRSWSKAPYEWVRIQSPKSPKSWTSVANPAA